MNRKPGDIIKFKYKNTTIVGYILAVYDNYYHVARVVKTNKQKKTIYCFSRRYN